MINHIKLFTCCKYLTRIILLLKNNNNGNVNNKITKYLYQSRAVSLSGHIIYHFSNTIHTLLCNGKLRRRQPVESIFTFRVLRHNVFDPFGVVNIIFLAQKRPRGCFNRRNDPPPLGSSHRAVRATRPSWAVLRAISPLAVESIRHGAPRQITPVRRTRPRPFIIAAGRPIKRIVPPP